MDPAPAPEAEISTSFTQGVDASKELVDDAKPISKSFTQDSTLENRITFKDDNNDGTVETKKRFAGVSRRKSMTYGLAGRAGGQAGGTGRMGRTDQQDERAKRADRTGGQQHGRVT